MLDACAGDTFGDRFEFCGRQQAEATHPQGEVRLNTNIVTRLSVRLAVEFGEMVRSDPDLR